MSQNRDSGGSAFAMLFLLLFNWLSWTLWRDIHRRTESVMYATLGTAATCVLAFQLLAICARNS